MWVAFANAKPSHIFLAKKKKKKKKKKAYMPYLMIKFNNTLTNDIVSFEQLGPDVFLDVKLALNV